MPITFPNVAYGNLKKPETQTILFKNATVWTNEKEGILEETDVLVKKTEKLLPLEKTFLDAYDITIDASGKHVYPGFIAPNSTLGLVEIDAVKPSNDEGEIGVMKPHIRSIIAYTADSKVIETVRPNGILMAQITSRDGRISGTSSIVQLDAWNWKDALIKENDGIHVNFPFYFKKRLLV